ncbi:TetR/AcrR family transcriptional regulator [Frondihabitans australicus]|uniref:TetR family transcriptional regulator n=1 Tax=Frondihabitans australicus TaxID=386892 RepID=A0A495ILC9_9MICO|nr:TetR/AcrR family transcriptional regulator [Frondihabitans australicus]RKR76081.1 TetR family transcriptional regulator [Frondihabitans australicus]
MRSENNVTRTQRARRDDILRAAIDVIAAEGYAAGSIAAIAESAGTSKGTVLYHFGSKAAVDDAVVTTLFESGAEFMRSAMSDAAGPAAEFRAYLTSNLRFIAENVSHVVAVHRILENRPPVDPAPAAVDQLASRLRAGQEAGVFGDFDAVVVAKTVRAVIDAASFHLTDPDGPGGDPVDVDHHITEVVALFERAIGSEES